MKKILLALFILCIPCTYAALAPASEVFEVQVKPIDANTMALTWKIKPGYFLYRKRIHLTTEDTELLQLGTLRFPASEIKKNPLGKPFKIYRNILVLPVGILGKQPGEGFIMLSYQGCSDTGICYPPEKKRIKLSLTPNLALSEVVLEAMPPLSTASAINEPDRISALFMSHSFLPVLLVFFGFGLLLSLTPCVLPMIPVLSGILLSHASPLTTRKAAALSLCYVLSMALTYAVFGAVVAVLGKNLQITLQSPVAIGIFSAVFVALAFSMFGLFDIRLPVAFQSKLAQINRKEATGHYLGAAIMGCFSTLILSPCVTPPLLGALGYIARTGNVLLGTVALFFMGLGMGVPLLLIGASAGRWLPKAGVWMNGVKCFFGFILLAMAIYLLDRITPAPLIMGCWAVLSIFAGVFTGAFQTSLTLHEKAAQATGIVLVLYGALLLTGATLGHTNPLQPLVGHGLIASDRQETFTQEVTTPSGLSQALSLAKGHPVLLDYYADWCASCKIMDATTFKDPRVISALKSYTVIRVNVTQDTPETKALLADWHVVAPPALLFLNAQGQEDTAQRLAGEIGADELLTRL